MVTTPSVTVCSALPSRLLPRLSSSTQIQLRQQHMDRTMFGSSSELMKFWKYGSTVLMVTSEQAVGRPEAESHGKSRVTGGDREATPGRPRHSLSVITCRPG